MRDNDHLSCSLSPGNLEVRKAMIAELLSDNPHAVESIPGGRKLTFPAGGPIEEELRHLVAVEAECCEFLTMTLTTTAHEMTLAVAGPPEAQAQLADIFEP
jgi:hypothetical protein